MQMSFGKERRCRLCSSRQVNESLECANGQISSICERCAIPFGIFVDITENGPFKVAIWKPNQSLIIVKCLVSCAESARLLLIVRIVRVFFELPQMSEKESKLSDAVGASATKKVETHLWDVICNAKVRRALGDEVIIEKDILMRIDTPYVVRLYNTYKVRRDLSAISADMKMSTDSIVCVQLCSDRSVLDEDFEICLHFLSGK